MSTHHHVPKRWVFLMFLFLVTVLGIGIVRGESSIENYIKLRKTREIIGKTVKTLEEENQSLSQEVVKLKKSRSYAKKVLKDKYHLTDSNEHIEFFPE